MAHSDEDKRIALLTLQSCKGNYTRASITCREFYDVDVSPDTIALWAKGEYISGEVLESSEELKRSVAEKCEEFAHKAIESMLGSIEGASLAQKATAFGIAVDKMLLLRGEPTSISKSELSEEEIILRLAELSKRAEEREKAQAEGITIDAEFSTPS